MPFASLGLAEPIRRALEAARYTTPTPIQTAAIPAVMAGRDLIAIAQTGTGKTAAFALPILHRLAEAPMRVAPKRCRVLVLSPTRELSGQIATAFTTYGKHLRLSVRLAIGGVPIGKQIRALAGGVDILVATPGRLLDLVKTRALDLSGVEVLVLDEADQMLDMGFIRDIRRIVGMLPSERQTLLLSATMPGEIAKLADEMLRDPATVSVTPPATTVERIDQRVIHLTHAEKPDTLAGLLRAEGIERTLIFTRTKHGADRVVRNLEKAGIAAEAIHGNKSQGQRERALGAFRSGRVAHLVATDIAARGIDVAGVSHVINYDLPNVPEQYVHRIGRTARAGAAGIAISLCSGDERPFLRSIEQLIRLKIGAEGAVPAEPEPRPARKASGPRRGRGPRQANGHRQDGPRQDNGPRQDAGPRQDRGRNKRRGPKQPARGPRPAYRGDDIGTVAFLRETAPAAPR